MAHQHPYHLVDQSPWPLTGAISGLMMTSGLVLWFHSQKIILLLVGLFLLILTMVKWWRDIVREATFQGRHTAIVEKGLRYGMILFITSEVCFFFAFFWAFFSQKISPLSWNRSYLTPVRNYSPKSIPGPAAENCCPSFFRSYYYVVPPQNSSRETHRSCPGIIFDRCSRDLFYNTTSMRIYWRPIYHSW